MRVLQVDGLLARCEAKGIERTVSLFLLQQEAVAPGDQILIHVGYAIQKLSQDEARCAWDVYDQMLAASVPQAGPDHA